MTSLPRIVANFSSAEWIEALTGVLALVVSIWAVRLLGKTLTLTRQTLAEAEKATAAAVDATAVTRTIGDVQTRAYVCVQTIEVFEGEAGSAGEGYKALFARVVVKNYGQTPAYGLSGWAACISYSVSANRLRERPEKGSTRNRLPLGPGSEFETRVPLTVPNGAKLSDEQLLIFGSFTYFDHTHKRRLCRFRYCMDNETKTFRPALRGNMVT